MVCINRENHKEGRCKDCKRSFCEHEKRKDQCRDCGNGYCEHNRRKNRCRDCDVGYCEHNRDKSCCKECGTGYCEHNRMKNYCKDCGGSGYCEHNRQKNQCKDCGRYCEHNRLKYQCKECGTGYCEHNRLKSRCRECGRGYCMHNKLKTACVDCDSISYLSSIIRTRIYQSLKNNKELSSLEYIGAPIHIVKQHIEEQFEEGMTWTNIGKWHIDHNIPIKYDNPSLDDVKERLHYTNLQPMWAYQNISKGNRYVGKYQI